MHELNIRSLIKKTFVLVMMLGMVLSGCTTGADIVNIENQNSDYEYSDYEFNSKQEQYYMHPHAAAAEKGYYYTAYAPVYTQSNIFIYYFDMVNMKSLPLCSKLDCSHDSQDCDAYLSQTECLGQNIWYYNERIYMIERTAERDTLVSYDKNGRDKKNCVDLLVDGLSVHKSSVEFCRARLSHGKLYYFLTDEDAMYLYEAAISGNEKPVLIKKYESQAKIKENVSLYAIGENVYVNHTKGVTETENQFIIDCYNLTNKTISTVINGIEDYSIRGEINNWNTEIYYDNKNHMYFVSICDGDFIINQFNLQSKENREIYVIKTENYNKENDSQSGGIGGKLPDTSYISLKGYDGKFIYIYQSINVSLKTQSDEQTYMYIVDMDGNLADTITFTKNEEAASAVESNTTNILIDYLGGDARYMLISSSAADLTGLEMKKTWVYKFNTNIQNNKQSQICSVGVLDKKQLGTGSHQWNNITPE